ncbi:MAG: hypothetical protein PHG00_02620 [Methylococcales bacterium]|nr:hypothetical protein [Methylococcales bacterium]
MIKSSIPEIFHAARLAKAFYFEMTEIYGNYAEQAANCIGFSMWSPGGHHLPMVAIYSHEQHNPFLEVRLVVQLATGFGGEDATELMKADSEIMALVKFADQNPFLN